MVSMVLMMLSLSVVTRIVPGESSARTLVEPYAIYCDEDRRARAVTEIVRSFSASRDAFYRWSMKKDRSTLKAVLIGLGALLYGASPVDVIPEIIAGPLGFGDDAIVLIGAGVAIWRIMRRRSIRRGNTQP
ncbi:DUF1232 domain-containing protein [Labedella populi]|uniref:DUF1232 domain-containing protein n=2 Tax=Labedella populi TaxID=2498850 RepID=A0A3S4BWT6_9MICO|nr:DUF1232 domain-containing protein [Labedella populi]